MSRLRAKEELERQAADWGRSRARSIGREPRPCAELQGGCPWDWQSD